MCLAAMPDRKPADTKQNRSEDRPLQPPRLGRRLLQRRLTVVGFGGDFGERMASDVRTICKRAGVLPSVELRTREIGYTMTVNRR